MRRAKRRSHKDRSTTIRLIGDTKLCPNCDLEFLLPRMPKRKSYTRGPVERTTLRVCSDLRAYGKRVGHECKFFSGMSLNGFLKPKGRKKR